MAAVNGFDRALGGTLMTSGALMVLSAPVVVAYQAVLWLRDGFWTRLTVWTAWAAVDGPEPSFAWQGVQQVAVGLLDMPLSLALFLAGLAVIWLATKLA